MPKSKSGGNGLASMARDLPPAALFTFVTLMGSLCWVLTKVLVLKLEAEDDDSTNTDLVIRVALFTTWATSLGASLSWAVSEVPVTDKGEEQLPLRASGAAVSDGGVTSSYSYAQLFFDALPFVVLFDLYCIFQSAGLLFLSVSVVTTDSYAAMMLATGVLSRAWLGTEFTRKQLAGLGFIVLALALVGILQEAFNIADDDGSSMGAVENGVTNATLGLICTLLAGCCYACTNVIMQRYLQGSPIDAFTLTAAYSLLAFISMTLVIYPLMWLAGATETSTEWWLQLQTAPIIFVSFVLAKLVWYNFEAVLVQKLGAVWAAVSGVALIAPAWTAELIAAYAYNADFGSRWQTPGSYLQLTIFCSLAIGVAIYNDIPDFGILG